SEIYKKEEYEQSLTVSYKRDMSAKADIYFMTNQKFFPAEKLYAVKEKLDSMTDEQIQRLMFVQMKDPTTYLLVSIFIGQLGVDRFLMNDIGMGILKLLTGGLCGILWIYDMVTIQDKVRGMNFDLFMNFM
ncbi:MAG TPA: TM2 domain-containing protein, partial [Clostridia bacterium]|nr:TM2 domain-containing protein [Clostridia bacterium]HOM35268.1 TM2 domain-containing protein [Clostridia bacterium]HOT71255.1 TM2 domain-containing protein [Clostridia bacterium]HQG01074.1 TM2 domain-containing protein [Clostridia bacterium]HQH66297.1 TM2 domain-containing protein [Clostridia bacterium]